MPFLGLVLAHDVAGEEQVNASCGVGGVGPAHGRSSAGSWPLGWGLSGLGFDQAGERRHKDKVLMCWRKSSSHEGCRELRGTVTAGGSLRREPLVLRIAVMPWRRPLSEGR